MKLKQLLISTTTVAAIAVVPISIVSCGNTSNNAVEELPSKPGGSTDGSLTTSLRKWNIMMGIIIANWGKLEILLDSRGYKENAIEFMFVLQDIDKKW